MHILMIRPFLEGGGATLSLLNLATGLVENGHKVSLAVSGGLWLSRAEEAGLPVYQIPLAPSTPYNLLIAARQIRQLVRRNHIDLVHSHHRFAGLACRFATWGLNIPLITTVHEYSTNLPYLTRLGMGEQIITFSHALREHLIRRYHLPAPKVIVVTMGVGQSGKLSNNNMRKRPSIGCIARLSLEKGVDILLQAMAQITNSTHHKPHCYIAGDGPLRRELISQAKKLNINDFVTFLGWQDNVKEFIVQFDFLVLPSYLEGFGLAVLEGWAQERPTIGSKVGGISELIEDGENGVLVPPGDSRALAGAILHFIENPNIVREMGKRGRLETLPKFTIERMVEETERIYAGLSEQ